MRTTILALMALNLFSACAATSFAPPQDYDPESNRRFSVLLGQRSLDEDDYAPLEDQALLGLEFSDGGTPDSIGFEVGFAGSSSSEDVFIPGFGTTDSQTTVGEIYAGVRKEFPGSGVRPFVGAGASMSTAELEVGNNTVDDTVIGLYVHGGLILPFSDTFAVILDARARFGDDYEFNNVEANGDFIALAIGLGFKL
ncbi:MAG: outer membrane beta-barrel protein [Planctomycetota bacterium]